ncbi:unnamed protein product, partial [Brassica oleracea]
KGLWFSKELRCSVSKNVSLGISFDSIGESGLMDCSYGNVQQHIKH